MVNYQSLNRKSSIDSKVGGAAAVTGVIKSSEGQPGPGEDGAHGQQIRSKAQYDNWLQLQVMKKGGPAASNTRSQSSHVHQKGNAR